MINKPKMNIRSIYKVYFLGLALITLAACENDIEVVKSLGKTENQPDILAINMDIIYSDSARVKGKVVTPQLKYYRGAEQPYFEYPKGMHVFFYNDSLKVIAEVSSKYAIYQESKKMWEARNDVQVVNTKGEKLNTEQLFWDMNKKKIYSSKYCKITLPDGTQQIGEKGMDAKEDFSNWNLYGFKGTMDVDDPK